MRNRKIIIFYLWIGLAWTLLWLLAYIGEHSDKFYLMVPNELWRNVYIISVNYIFVEFAFPLIGKRRKFLLLNILTGVFLVAILVLLLSFGLYGWRQLGIETGIYTSLREHQSVLEGVEYHGQAGVASAFFFGISRHIYYHIKLKISAQQLQIEKQLAELNYLRAQTNPHFLFNTLHNIYSLAREKSDLAPESLLRLSEILRYMLYETRGDFVEAEDELRMINNYIDLEKLRYDDSLEVRFRHDLEDPKQPVPPLLLIPLVENAFKHGASESTENPFIHLDLLIKQKQLLFTVKNSSEAADEQPVVENIGISNLRRQLELLYKEHDLRVGQRNNIFTASLRINLLTPV